MASPRLSRRVAKVVRYPPLSQMSEDQRREFQDALLEADALEELPGNAGRLLHPALQVGERLQATWADCDAAGCGCQLGSGSDGGSNSSSGRSGKNRSLS
jgi:hypothetical protein